MANLAQAKKALRQNVKHAARNKIIKDEISSLRRKWRVAMKAKKPEEAKKLVAILQKKMDKAAQKKVMKANTVARLKSRMASDMKKTTEK